MITTSLPRVVAIHDEAYDQPVADIRVHFAFRKPRVLAGH
jgi:hypothetical protein